MEATSDKQQATSNKRHATCDMRQATSNKQQAKPSAAESSCLLLREIGSRSVDGGVRVQPTRGDSRRLEATTHPRCRSPCRA
jgi:hypothetical protein